jgi:hypothetical protein
MICLYALYLFHPKIKELMIMLPLFATFEARDIETYCLISRNEN